MRITKIIILLVIVLISSNTFSASGPPIPLPQVSITKAIELASDFFYSGAFAVREGSFIKREEYFIISVVYTTKLEWPVLIRTDNPDEVDSDESDIEWGWRVIFTHSTENSTTVGIKVSNSEEVVLLGKTI